MPDQKPLAVPCDTRYLYDGGLAGFFCCVFESVYRRELPSDILPEEAAQPSLLTEKHIVTAYDKAQRVRDSIPKKISPQTLRLVENVFLSCLEKKEIKILRFLLKGYRDGANTMKMLGHPDVAVLLKAEKHLLGEAHLLLGFVRFSDYDGALIATITPKNFVLPYLVNHFVNRYSGENFMIYDKIHKAALIYENRRQRIIQLDGIDFPDVSKEEESCRALWKQFYNTIAIEERYNPKCRMTHMPKRYWENMTEMKDLL